ncbi:hypothetical protein FPV67DRAFT_287353 [Lyophyllum atratum]|nr:hypothetical protein FPV67DRAFT_287353 [Lyophyllum atratum]
MHSISAAIRSVMTETVNKPHGSWRAEALLVHEPDLDASRHVDMYFVLVSPNIRHVDADLTPPDPALHLCAVPNALFATALHANGPLEVRRQQNICVLCTRGDVELEEMVLGARELDLKIQQHSINSGIRCDPNRLKRSTTDFLHGEVPLGQGDNSKTLTLMSSSNVSLRNIDFPIFLELTNLTRQQLFCLTFVRLTPCVQDQPTTVLPFEQDATYWDAFGFLSARDPCMAC